MVTALVILSIACMASAVMWIGGTAIIWGYCLSWIPTVLFSVFIKLGSGNIHKASAMYASFMIVMAVLLFVGARPTGCALAIIGATLLYKGYVYGEVHK